MGESSPTYKVVSSGEMNPGFDPDNVIESCAKLFKTTPEKAKALLNKPRVLKKGLDLETARAYVQKLEGIGLVVTVKEQKAEPVKAPLTLALEPTEEELNAPQEKPGSPEQSTNTVTCPKCQLVQEMAEQCAGCGVYLHKVLAASAEPTAPPPDLKTPSRPGANITNSAPGKTFTSNDSADETSDEPAPFNLKALAAAAGAALLGALLWKFIAVAFGYEFGLIAWLIGGAIGYAAIALGGQGQNMGIACGVLAVAAIFGGKYMATQSLQSQWFEILTEAGEFDTEEFRPIYDGIMEAAVLYQSEVHDDETLRQFMVDYGYSESMDTGDVTYEEITEFREYYEPELQKMALEQPGFEEWVKSSFEQEIKDLSTWDLMQEDFGLIDMLFLLFGVGTAYRLGCGLRS
ncbi:hypothetical protein [Hahella ganghwensis]|uniref:hypothetical protein n=1 Tax=Hahella ganghwensis TaxID=286420 RepID=UPI00038026C0|nr:hypothetical protein [Hahella ganghwensis]